jgi:hypothetical protein
MSFLLGTRRAQDFQAVDSGSMETWGVYGFGTLYLLIVALSYAVNQIYYA